jgi:hypothetical protein
VTIVPKPRVYDFLVSIQNVGPEDFDYSMENTYTQAVSRISHIRSLYGIEREFDRYYMRLKNKLDSHGNHKDDKEIVKN